MLISCRNGKSLMSGSDNRTIKIWELDTRICTRTIDSQGSGILSVAVSSDGTFWVSGDRDGVIKVWDTVTRLCLRTLVTESGDSRLSVAVIV
jgi:WD40 repeat protein